MHDTRQDGWQKVFGFDIRMQHDKTGYMDGCGRLPVPLSHEEEYAALLCVSDGDPAARNLLIERNLRLAAFIARKFQNTGFGIEDLISIGVIGLIKAVNSFDMVKKIRLATYASLCIRNEILMVLRRTKRTRMECSLDEPIHIDREGNELLLTDILGTEGDPVSHEIDAAVERQMLHKAINCLDSREKEIVGLRYGLHDGPEHTQREVAAIMGISQSYISKMEKRIMKRLHTEMSKAM